MMNNIKISYEKVYTDDSGKKIPNAMMHDYGDVLIPKMLWRDVVDGFISHDNVNIAIMALSGNIRIVVVSDESSAKFKFEQYFLSEFDGKIIEIPSNTKYAVQNIDERKSIYLTCSPDVPEIKYFNKSIFNWRKKQP